MSEGSSLVLESYREKFNRRLREEGIAQHLESKNGQEYYPVPRDETEWQVFQKILNELSPADKI